MSDLVLRRSSSEASFLTDKFPLKPCTVVKPLSIFVANLNSDISNKQLASDVTDLFSKFGKIYPVKVSRDSNNRPFAFVKFQNGEIISQVLSKKLYLHSRRLRIEKTKSHATLIIPYISQLCLKSLDEIESFLLNFGPIDKLSMHHEQLTCIFTTKEDAMNAFLYLQSSGITCSLSKPIPGHVMIGNLPLDFTESEILNLFLPFGPILHTSCEKGKITILKSRLCLDYI